MLGPSPVPLASLRLPYLRTEPSVGRLLGPIVAISLVLNVLESAISTRDICAGLNFHAWCMGDGALAGLRYSARNVLALLQRGGGEGVVAMVIWPCVYDHAISNLLTVNHLSPQLYFLITNLGKNEMPNML